ncbi:MAG: hypothetical protein O2967_22190 [Proteobacteria bacterium]|nr:hypothetical protein [Pseudomonadota bacterium]
MSAGSITILRCLPGKTATKTWRIGADGNLTKVDFNAGMHFNASVQELTDIYDLSRFLHGMEGQSNAFVIRGEPKPGVNISRPVRRKKRGEDAPFQEAGGGRYWVLVDFDKVPCSADIDLISDPEGAIKFLLNFLPKEFRHATCHWQLSSSAGMGDGTTVSAHLWFWFGRAVTEGELTVWADSIDAPIDIALFRTVQPHYTAAPNFADGLSDPIRLRSGLLSGLVDSVDFPEIDLPESDANEGPGGDFTGVVGFEEQLAKIGHGKDRRGFHDPILRAIAAHVGTHGRATNRTALKDKVRQAIRAAPRRPEIDLGRYLSDAYLDDSIRGAIEKFGDAHRRQHRLIADVPPAYSRWEELDAVAGSKKLHRLIDHYLEKTREFSAVRREFDARREAAHQMIDTEKQAELDAETPRGFFGPDEDVEERIEAEVKVRKSAATRDIKAHIKASHGIADLDHAPRLQIKAAAGLGKSQAFISAYNRLRMNYVDIYVSTTALAEELLDRFPSEARVRVIRGRENGAPDDPMCPRWQVAAAAARAGLKVYETVCRKVEYSDSVRQCPFFDGCRYLAQFSDKDPGIRIWAQDYLILARPFGLPRSDLVIVDESAVNRFIGQLSFSLDRLAGLAAKAAKDHLDTGVDYREALIDRGITKEMALEEARALEVETDSKVHPGMPDETALRAIQKLTRNEDRKLARFWRSVAAEIDIVRPLHGVKIRADAPVKVNGETERQCRVEVAWRRRAQIANTTAVLLCDADASLEINQRIFGGWLTEVDIPVLRNAHVIQCYSTRLAKARLVGLKTDMPAMTQVLRSIQEIIDKEVAAGSRVLVVTNKPVRMVLAGDNAEGRASTIKGADVAHFGNLRGSDLWANHDTVIIIGREQAPPAAVDAMSRAIWCDDPDPLKLAGERGYLTEARGYTMRDGSRHGVLTHVHPDRRGQLLLELIRERESLQAIDRIRLIHCPEPKRVLILCSVPLDIMVDKLVTLKELRQGGSRFDRAWARAGLLPLSARDLHKAFPDLWKTTGAADDWIRQHGGSFGPIIAGVNVNKDSIYKHPPYSIARYRIAGRRGRLCRVLYDPTRHPGPREALWRLLGLERRGITVFRLDAQGHGGTARSEPEQAKTGILPLFQAVSAFSKNPVPDFITEVCSCCGR